MKEQKNPSELIFEGLKDAGVKKAKGYAREQIRYGLGLMLDEDEFSEVVKEERSLVIDGMRYFQDLETAERFELFFAIVHQILYFFPDISTLALFSVGETALIQRLAEESRREIIDRIFVSDSLKDAIEKIKHAKGSRE
ncbi:MAG: hypothetical protein ABI758_01820 [Candidatus Woesebacteria bacterium]